MLSLEYLNLPKIIVRFSPLTLRAAFPGSSCFFVPLDVARAETPITHLQLSITYPTPINQSNPSSHRYLNAP